MGSGRMPGAPYWTHTDILPTHLVQVLDRCDPSAVRALDDQVASELKSWNVGQLERALLVRNDLETLLDAGDCDVDAAGKNDVDGGAKRHAREVNADVAIIMCDVGRTVVEYCSAQCTSSHGDVRRRYVDTYIIH